MDCSFSTNLRNDKGPALRYFLSIKRVVGFKVSTITGQFEEATMTRLLVVFVLAMSVACVASYQQAIQWGSGNDYNPYGYGSSGYGSYWGSGSGGYYPFAGGLGGLSVYGSGGSSGSFGYSPNYMSNSYYGPGNGQGFGWYGQQQQVRNW
uniref:Glycine rich superfamily member n=1 Tax=Rhipicephalus zambeziensis TaxID=60191 RepID=A0A224YDQ3_9ACAR